LGARSRWFESSHPDHTGPERRRRQDEERGVKVRIYRRSKSAMQSGRAVADTWAVEFPPSAAQEAYPLNGWTMSGDMQRQLRLEFDSKEEAVAYAEREGLAYVIEPDHTRQLKPKSYSDNFRYDRVGRWTH
jgi:ETC complex I subunit conserved region